MAFGYKINGKDISEFYDTPSSSNQPVATSEQLYQVKNADIELVKYNQIYTSGWGPDYIIGSEISNYEQGKSFYDRAEFFSGGNFSPKNTNVLINNDLSNAGSNADGSKSSPKVTVALNESRHQSDSYIERRFWCTLEGLDDNKGKLVIDRPFINDDNYPNISGKGTYTIDSKYIIVQLVGGGGGGGYNAEPNINYKGANGGGTTFCLIKVPDPGVKIEFLITLGKYGEPVNLFGKPLSEFTRGAYSSDQETELSFMTGVTAEGVKTYKVAASAAGGLGVWVNIADTFYGDLVPDKNKELTGDHRVYSGKVVDDEDISPYIRSIATYNFTVPSYVVNEFDDLPEPTMDKVDNVAYVKNAATYYRCVFAEPAPYEFAWMPIDIYATHPKYSRNYTYIGAGSDYSDITVVNDRGKIPTDSYWFGVLNRYFYKISTGQYFKFERGTSGYYYRRPVDKDKFKSIYTYEELDGHFGAFARFTHQETYPDGVWVSNSSGKDGCIFPHNRSNDEPVCCKYTNSYNSGNITYLCSGGSSFCGPGAQYKVSSYSSSSIPPSLPSDIDKQVTRAGYGGGGAITTSTSDSKYGGEGAAFLYW